MKSCERKEKRKRKENVLKKVFVIKIISLLNKYAKVL